jgi:hypothetical protein
MSPASYLRYCQSRYLPADWTDFTEHLQQSLGLPAMIALKERFLAGEPVDALFLDADPLTGEIVTQEGQHRAYLAQTLNIALVPVLIYARIRELGLVSEKDIPDFRLRLHVLFDEAPELSAQVAADLQVGPIESGLEASALDA